MGHLYPLAETAEAAISGGLGAGARTLGDAQRAAGERAILGLQTDWLTVSDDEAAKIVAAAERGVGQGFVQRYEDEAGAPVLAVTYWKLGDDEDETGAVPDPSPPPAPPAAPEPDHTDDLYFRGGRTRPRKRRRPADPRQLDLFSGPDPMGYEHRDPDNPGIVLTDEEGDGTTFGGG